MAKTSVLCVAAFGGALAAAPALGQEAFNVGVSAALTGPVAGTYAPAVEGLRLYIDKVYQAGGIDGKEINLIIQDDQAEPSRATANARRLLTQDEVALLVNASLSSTYAPMIAEAKRAGVPLLFSSSACPTEVFPPADPSLFCTTAFGARYDSRAALSFIEAQAGADVRLGLVAMAIPLSRGEIDYAEELAREKGMNPVEKAVIPPATPDFSAFATALQQAEPDWVWAWAPWVAQVRPLEGLRRLGWEGDYLAWSHLEAEGELARLKDGRFYVLGANALFNEGLPVQQEIRAAAEAANSDYPAEQLTEGWIAGLVIEAALRAAGDADPQKIQAAMQNLSVDTKGLRGGPIEWTENNHFRTTQYYRIYRWNPEGNAIETVSDWQSYEVE